MKILTKIFNIVYDIVHIPSDHRGIKSLASTLKTEYPKESDDYIQHMAESLYRYNRGI